MLIHQSEIAKLERLAGKIAYILEQVLQIPEEERSSRRAIDCLQDIAQQWEVLEAYNLFKEIGNRYTDLPELRTKEE